MALLFFLLLFIYIMFRVYIMFIFYICSRYLLWAVGVIIFFLMIYYSIFRYVLPWGQMFILGRHCNLPTCIYNSGIGEKLVTLLWGGYFVSQTALKSVFRIHHFFLPFILIALCFLTSYIITCNIIQVNHYV